MKHVTNSLPDNWQVRLIQLLTVPGMLLAFYLLLYHEGRLVEICTGSGWDDCGKVSGPDAPYSSIGPIPVALIGLVGYAAIFLVTWAENWLEVVEDYLPELLIGLTAVAFLFSLGLTGLELLVIQAICRYCVVSAVLITIMFLLAIHYIRSLNAEEL